MVLALLRAPRSASELASLCGLGKATISHHVAVLSKAGLVTTVPRRGKVVLSPNREVILGLGDRIVNQAPARLFVRLDESRGVNVPR
jgi:DNA-binding transcriptional ArsR family regulator